jgi:hypothetical protein
LFEAGLSQALKQGRICGASTFILWFYGHLPSVRYALWFEQCLDPL